MDQSWVRGRSLAFAGVGFLLTSALFGCSLEAQSSEEPVEASHQPVLVGDAGFVRTVSFSSADAYGPFSYNSSGGTNHITRLGAGSYEVDFPGIGLVIGGHVQVTALSFNQRCKVVRWAPAGSTLQVFVNCYSATGSLVDTLFEANYIRRGDTPGAEAAYVYAFLPSSASYDAASRYAWNSTGGSITITHTPGSGTYAVNLTGQDLSQGTVEVTAYGSGNSYCKVVGWGLGAVNVACFDGTSGAPVESIFDVLFSTRLPNGSPSSSYLWANQPTSSSYNPSPFYARGLINVSPSGTPSVVSTPPTITRTGTGRYTVQFPLMANIAATPSNVKVTGYGGGSDTCAVVNWGHTGSDGWATVACFAVDGSPVDALYTITYSSPASIVG